jgi:hypothetical protein
MLIFFIIALAPIGIVGGIWLWDYLGKSDLFRRGFTIFPKIFSVIGIIGLGIFTYMGFDVSFSGDLTLIDQITQMGTLLLFFMCWYFIGYLISIWNPKEIETQESQKFKIKWKLSLMVFGVLGIYCLVIFLILYFPSPSLFLYFIMAGVGFALGWIFWEHIGELDLLKGEFHKALKIMSILSTIPLVILVILGFMTINTWDFGLKRIVILGYCLFIYLMWTYLIGLAISIFKKR